MKRILLAPVAIFSIVINLNVFAFNKGDVQGEWCFYEQSLGKEIIQEKVEISLNSDGTYLWQEGGFKQSGTWGIKDGNLDMENVGSHEIKSIEKGRMILVRYSQMYFSQGKCSDDYFAGPDITIFHNGASMGNVSVLNKYIDKGIDVNIVDWDKKDTALIKAAKFCQVDAAKFLLSKNADVTIKNEEGKIAKDYAKSSRYHKGCDVLAKLL